MPMPRDGLSFFGGFDRCLCRRRERSGRKNLASCWDKGTVPHEESQVLGGKYDWVRQQRIFFNSAEASEDDGWWRGNRSSAQLLDRCGRQTNETVIMG